MSTNTIDTANQLIAENAKLNAEVARLNEQVRALAAEGKVYQGVIFRLISMLSLSGYTSLQDSLNPAEALFFDAEKALDAPATDAILNEVRAQTVEDVVTVLAESGCITLGDAVVVIVDHAARIRAGEVPDA